MDPSRAAAKSARESAKRAAELPEEVLSGVEALARRVGGPPTAAAAALFAAVHFGSDSGLCVHLDGGPPRDLDDSADITFRELLGRIAAMGELVAISSGELKLDVSAAPWSLAAASGGDITLYLEAARIDAAMRAALTSPDDQVSTLEVLPEVERAEILARLTGPITPVPSGTVLDRVIELAALTPDAPAVEDRERRLSYAELAGDVARLAAGLRQHGVGRGERIAVLLSRSVDVVTIMLAIWAVGSTYVPLDPTAPAARIEAILADATCTLLIVDDAANTDGTGAVKLVLTVDDLRDESVADALAANDGAHAGDIAYIIYTSGSTGTPKGVEVAHRPFLNTIAAKAALLCMVRDDRSVAVMSIAFDASLFELCIPLFSGASVHVASQSVVAQFDMLGMLIDRSGATVMGATPPTWRGLLDSGWLPTRRMRVMAGGETLPADLAMRLATHMRCFNMYGLTETAITSTAFEIDERPLEGSCPIGAPLANAKLSILDRFGRLTPIGQIGELFVGGVGVAERYRNRIDLTAERFVELPVDPRGGRYFRTGDRARLRPDGLVEFHGRRDRQVKVRGVRIELEDVETALLALDGAADGAVVHWGDSDNQRLTAFVVTRGGVTRSQLLDGLKAALPDAAVPRDIRFVDELPTTQNGKVDRLLLEASAAAAVQPSGARTRRHVGSIDHKERNGERDGSAASTLDIIEDALAALVTDTALHRDMPLSDLGLDSVGRATLRRNLAAVGLTVSHRDLARDLSLSELASLVERQVRDHDATASPLPDSLRALDNQRLPIMVHLANPGRGAWNCQIACSLRGKLDLALLERSWQRVAERHDALRIAFPWRGHDHPRVRIDASAVPKLNHVRVSAIAKRAADEAIRIQEEELSTQFEFDQPPLYRVTLVELSEDSFELLWTYFSALFDGWSSAIVLREVFAEYEASLREGSARLAPAPSFFAFLADHEARSWESAEAFFKKEFSDYVLPTSLASPPGGTEEERDVGRLPPEESQLFTKMGERPFWVDRPGHLELPFSSELREQVYALAQHVGVAVSTVLLSAWSAVLMREYERSDVVLGMVAANRPNFTTAVGKYTSLLPFRMRITSDVTVADWLRSAQQHVDAVHEHEGAPVRTWVRNLISERWQMPYESTFTYVNYAASRPPPLSSDVSVRHVRQIEGGIPPVFGMVVIPGAPGTMRLEYNARCELPANLLERMLGTFGELVSSLDTGLSNTKATELLERPFGSARYGVPIALL